MDHTINHALKVSVFQNSDRIMNECTCGVRIYNFTLEIIAYQEKNGHSMTTLYNFDELATIQAGQMLLLA